MTDWKHHKLVLRRNERRRWSRGRRKLPFHSWRKAWDTFFVFCSKLNRADAVKSAPSALSRALEFIFRWKFTHFSGLSVIEKALRSIRAPLPTLAFLFLCNYFFLRSNLHNLPQLIFFFLDALIRVYLVSLIECLDLCSCGSFFVCVCGFLGLARWGAPIQALWGFQKWVQGPPTLQMSLRP